MDIGGTQQVGGQYNAPSQPPPGLAGMGGIGGMGMGAGAATMAPPAAARTTAAPPSMQASPSLPMTAGVAGAGVSAWQNTKKVEALWTINEDRNSWMGVSGIGWRKLAPSNETALCALTMLAAHARFANATINYREEADGQVHEIYVW
jgi:hypothetical protein